MMFPGRSWLRLAGILSTVVLMVAASSVFAQDLPGSRYPISRSDIAKLLAVVGVSVEASQVNIPAGMSAASISPKLEIVTVQPIGNDQIRLQLRCPTVAECLPFFGTLDVKEPNLISAEIRLKSGQAIAADRQMAIKGGEVPVSQPQIRVGSHVVLIMQDGHMNIHLQVLAIDAGVLGEQVRVSTLDRKKVFRATVAGEGVVTGAIE